MSNTMSFVSASKLEYLNICIELYLNYRNIAFAITKDLTLFLPFPVLHCKLGGFLLSDQSLQTKESCHFKK